MMTDFVLLNILGFALGFYLGYKWRDMRDWNDDD